tara:strand:+ start:5731 stop:5976 length:246 start_codon:yes stop_codon:yes gene_type:complete
MATDKKITALNACTSTDVNSSVDSLVIVNANESKKITPNALMTGRVQSTNVTNLVTITQNNYDNLVSANAADANTLYIITI